jgi:hypothetical protein
MHNPMSLLPRCARSRGPTRGRNSRGGNRNGDVAAALTAGAAVTHGALALKCSTRLQHPKSPVLTLSNEEQFLEASLREDRFSSNAEETAHQGAAAVQRGQSKRILEFRIPAYYSG